MAFYNRRYIIISLVFCFVLPYIQSQTLYDYYYKTGYDNVRTSDPICNSDSSIVVLNYTIDSATGRQDVGFLKIDKYGNVIVQNSFILFNKDHAGFINMKNFIAGTACSYFLSGSTTYNSIAAIVLCKINKTTLDTIKVKIYKDPFNYYSMNNLIRINENKFYLIGNRTTSSNIISPVIFQIDSNLIITNTINISNIPVDYQCKSVIWNPINKNFVFTGNLLAGQRPITMLQLDTLGIVNHSVTSISSFTTNFVQTFNSNVDSSYIGIGVRVDSIYGNNKLYKLAIGKFNKNLNLLWLKTYGEEALYNTLWDGVVLNDGSIVCSGSYSKLTSLPMSNLNQNGVILKVDKNGNLTWMREYDNQPAGNNWETFFGIVKSKDGGFVACGNIVNMPKAKAWVVNTNSLGCVVPGCISSTVSVDSIAVPPPPPPPDTSTVGFNKFSVQKLEWIVYPNPANSQLNIKVENVSHEKQLILRFYTIYGIEVKHYSIEENNLLDISDLKDGLYILQLYDSAQLISTKKLEVVR